LAGDREQQQRVILAGLGVLAFAESCRTAERSGCRRHHQHAEEGGEAIHHQHDSAEGRAGIAE
jgi:hypothetical protein